jgi:hypothetical protein
MEERKEMMIDLSTQEPEVDHWIANNKKKLESLLRPIVENLFHAEKAIKE